MSIKSNWLCFRTSTVVFLEKHWEEMCENTIEKKKYLNCYRTNQIQVNKFIIEMSTI